MPNVGFSLSAHDAALVRWDGADGYVLQPLFSPYKQFVATTLDQRTQPPGACTQRKGIFPIPTYHPAHVPTIAAGYVSHPPVRDGVLDVPLVGFYATTPFTRPTTALNKSHNPPSH